MDVLNKSDLLRQGGETSPGKEVLKDKKVVVIYFSAHWCPPCRAFTPILKDFYESVKDQGVEIVFVSSDGSPEDMISYMKESHGDWWALKHGSDETHALKSKYGIKGIPSAVVVRTRDGATVTKEGRSDIRGKGPDAAKEWLKEA